MTSVPTFLIDGPDRAELTLVLAHGAGAPMDTPFMDFFAHAVARAGFRALRFEFPYMHARRSGGGRKPPNPMPTLLKTWQAVIDTVGVDALVIGGKSMGGRVASMLADQAGVRGLVCLGYPFHPAGKPERTRIEHLAELRTPTLICQGERDPFGRREEVEGYPLSPQITMHWSIDGDHGLKPRKASGRVESQNWNDAADATIAFAQQLRA